MKMRQAISVPAQPHPKQKKKEPEPLMKVATPEVSAAKIIEEKPKKAVVEDYMQDRANALTVQKMK